MIPGGWFKTIERNRWQQHWRKHGQQESICAKRVLCIDGGSLLPIDGMPMCAACRRRFVTEAIIALPKAQRLYEALLRYAKG